MNNNDQNYSKSNPGDEKIAKSGKKRSLNFIKHFKTNISWSVYSSVFQYYLRYYVQSPKADNYKSYNLINVILVYNLSENIFIFLL